VPRIHASSNPWTFGPFLTIVMKIVIQNYSTGELAIEDVPSPAVRRGGVLVRNAVSLVSAGTEKLMVELAQKSLVGKARERPDLVHQVLQKMRKDGILSTYETVRSRLDNPVPLGYSTAGTVISVGEGVDNFQAGDRIACAGSGYANHAEIIFVPKNLAVKLPDEVDFESAVFTTMGAIALQGLRLAEIQLGETVVVIGLGLVGLLTAQLAGAAGCRVIGMDIDQERCRLARKMGIADAVTENSALIDACKKISPVDGADKVLITAGTKGNGPVDVAGEIARDKAIVVAVGAVGMEIPRKTYYGKELTFRVSRSYGPGRYDNEYEEKGRDYPAGYVRWTENRNMQAFVQMLAEHKVDVHPLITHRFTIEDAIKAYDLITGKTREAFLGILLTYQDQPDLSTKVALKPGRHQMTASAGVTGVKAGMLGAGSFARSTLIPAMENIKDVELVGVCTTTGVSAHHAARKFGFRYATTNEDEILKDPDVNTVVIATRHDLHARQVIAALRAGKNVFVEKPLCLTQDELREIVTVYSSLSTTDFSPVLMVGYNRRFAPMAVKMKEFLSQVDEPLVMTYRVNAGYIPPDHWVQDPQQGGGRIIGEVCHFVDFLSFLSGSLPENVYARGLPNRNRYRDDNLVITIEFKNGSIGTVIYVANADKSFPKERVEVFGGGAAAMLDNYMRLEMLKGGKSRIEKSRLKQDKGHRGEWSAFSRAISGKGSCPISFEETVVVMQATFGIVDSLKQSVPVKVLSPIE
jgi:predicted dehydrogenase/threonine dehydrogenase-like Zn-dependent dehydrogenase